MGIKKRDWLGISCVVKAFSGCRWLADSCVRLKTLFEERQCNLTKYGLRRDNSCCLFRSVSPPSSLLISTAPPLGFYNRTCWCKCSSLSYRIFSDPIICAVVSGRIYDLACLQLLWARLYSSDTVTNNKQLAGLGHNRQVHVKLVSQKINAELAWCEQAADEKNHWALGKGRKECEGVMLSVSLWSNEAAKYLGLYLL